MNGMTCDHCGAETSNGLALCERDRAGTLVLLEFIPIYYRNLARWKPGRAGSRPVPGSRIPAGVLPSKSGDRVGDALDLAGSELATWAACLEDDRGVPIPDASSMTDAEQASAICALLTEHLGSISTIGWVGDFVASLLRIEVTLRRLTEDVVPGWYAGSCRQCETSTYVVPGLTWVTCGRCGATTYARDHLEIILSEARGWIARPKRIAEAIVALVDTEASVPRLHDRIRQWEQRSRLTAVRRLDADGDEVGPKRYRLGDVLDLILVTETPKSEFGMRAS